MRSEWTFFSHCPQRHLALQGSKGTWELVLLGVAAIFPFKGLISGRGVGEMAGAAAAVGG